MKPSSLITQHSALSTILITALLIWSAPVPAQHVTPSHDASHEHGVHQPSVGTPQWEGSPEGKAYSEFNHHLAGVFVLLIGLTELREALALSRLAWTRFLLPLAMLGVGSFLLIWSDHDAWPIGSLSVMQTFFGNDPEMLQHKVYGILLLTVGLIELLKRAGRLTHTFWKVPLPVFAIIGGLMLFLHSHGVHPSAHKIALHHTAMGTMAIIAGSCKLVSARTTSSAGSASPSRWGLAWAGLILAIGTQLLFYSE